MKKIIIARTFKQKLLGLMGKKNINYCLLLLNVNKIHTFLMKENIDLIGLNKDYQVIEIIANVSKNKIILLKESIHTLEVPENYSKNFNIGQKIDIDQIL